MEWVETSTHVYGLVMSQRSEEPVSIKTWKVCESTVMAVLKAEDSTMERRVEELPGE